MRQRDGVGSCLSGAAIQNAAAAVDRVSAVLNEALADQRQ
jgi:hypothetical protein